MVLEAARIVRLDSVPIPRREVFRRAGYPAGRLEDVPEGIRSLLEAEVERARTFFEPRGIVRLLRVSSRSDSAIAFQDTDVRFHSRQVAALLRKADRVVAFLTTIGPALEREVDALTSAGETTRAFLLDAVGSETADALADALHRGVLSQEADAAGYRVTPRFSPGYGDWPLESQRELVPLCEGMRIGVSLTPSCMMLPRKSVSAVLGWIPKE
jgi:hypothetical protein